MERGRFRITAWEERTEDDGKTTESGRTLGEGEDGGNVGGGEVRGVVGGGGVKMDCSVQISPHPGNDLRQLARIHK